MSLVKINGVEIESNFPAEREELENYYKYVLEREPDVTKIKVHLCEDGCVDVDYTAPKVKFERIRRITG